MSELTEQELEEIRKRCEATTSERCISIDTGGTVRQWTIETASGGYVADFRREEDADFFISVIPALLDLVDSLRAENARFRDALHSTNAMLKRESEQVAELQREKRSLHDNALRRLRAVEAERDEARNEVARTKGVLGEKIESLQQQRTEARTLARDNARWWSEMPDIEPEANAYHVDVFKARAHLCSNFAAQIERVK